MGDFPAMEGRPTDRVSAFKPGYVTAPDALAYPMFLTGLWRGYNMLSNNNVIPVIYCYMLYLWLYYGYNL